jgi:hypothetical protein
MNRTRFRRLLVACVISFPLIGSCSSGGDECDVCTTDDDCKAGLVCASFTGEDTKRCATGLGNTVCRVR